MEIKCKLKVILVDRGIKQKDFSKKINISEIALSKLCNNNTIPNLRVALSIANLLNLKVEDIWIIDNNEEVR